MAIVFAVSACSGGVVDESEPTADDEAPPELPTTEAGELDIAALADFVEEQRGHTFPTEPEVRFETAESFAGTATAASGGLEGDIRLLAAFGLVDADFDPADFDPAAAGNAAGFCCPVQVVPGDDPLQTAGVVVHELTHLLDVSVVGRVPAYAAGIDFSYQVAIIEGNASRVAAAFLAQFDMTDEELRGRAPIGLPPALDLALFFPYGPGRLLSEAIAFEGGEEAIDEALEILPVSAEQVMFPDAFLAGEEPASIDMPGVGEGILIQSGTIGTHILWLAARESTTDTEANRIVRAWAGDTYALRRFDDGTCLLVAIMMDDPSAASSLRDALKQTAPEIEIALVEERLDLRSCSSLT